MSAAEGAISPTAAPGMMRFYYQSQEFETPQEDWNEAFAGAPGERQEREEEF